MKCEVIAVSQGYGKLEGKSGQEIISYTARVSNPGNQMNFDTAAGLLRYCIREKHWSIFEQADMTIEINTCLLYTSPSPRDLSTSRMPSSA